MAKTFLQSAQNADALSDARIINVAAPFDVRSIVDTYDDLFVKSTFGLTNMYIGMMVTTYDTQDVYVLVKKPGSRDNDAKYRENIQWKKVNGSDFNPEDAATKIITSVDDLTSVSFAYPGMMVYVNGGDSEEGGLYILSNTPASNPDNWKPISTVNVNNNYFNYNTGIDSSNAPEGISVSSDRGMVVTDYVVDGIKGKGMYTSQGINSTGENNPLLEGVDYIDIYPLDASGDSYIRLYKDGDNWTNIHIVDDSLGIDPSKILVEDGEFVDGEDIAKGTSVSFGKDIDFTGWVVKTNNGDSYIFGEEIGYDDVDIYRESYLPVAYINVDGTVERILTETDKNELDERIENIGDNIMIKVPGASESEEEEVSIQEVINNITNNINNIDVISNDDITRLF